MAAARWAHGTGARAYSHGGVPMAFLTGKLAANRAVKALEPRSGQRHGSVAGDARAHEPTRLDRPRAGPYHSHHPPHARRRWESVLRTTAPRPSPSGAWTDRLLARLEALPGPLWVTLAACTAVGIVLVHLSEWLVGDLPFGRFDLYRATLGVYPFGFLGLIAIQNRVNLHALERFRPACGLDDASFTHAAEKLTHQPPGPTLLLSLVFGIVGLVIEVGGAGAGDRMTEFPIAFGIDLAVVFIAYMTVGPWTVVAFRLLRRVVELHRDAPRVDLLNPEPVRAFSSATAVLSGSAIAIATFSLATGSAMQEGAVGLALYALLMVLAFAAFLVPLWGMHRRLLSERARMLTDAGGRLEATLARLYAHIDDDRPGVSDLRDRLMALVAARDLVAQQSTWPWRPETLRWFVSALIVPIVIWGVTRLLEGAFRAGT